MIPIRPGFYYRGHPVPSPITQNSQNSQIPQNLQQNQNNYLQNFGNYQPIPVNRSINSNFQPNFPNYVIQNNNPVNFFNFGSNSQQYFQNPFFQPLNQYQQNIINQNSSNSSSNSQQFVNANNQKRKFSEAFNVQTTPNSKSVIEEDLIQKSKKVKKIEVEEIEEKEEIKLKKDEIFVETSPSSWHSFVVKRNDENDDEILCFGDSSAGQLGLGFSEEKGTATRILKKFPKSKFSVKFIRTGGWHSFIILEDNSLWVTGSNKFGQLGIGEEKENLEIFKENQFFKESVLKDVRLGDCFSVFLTEKGEIFSCGSGRDHRTGFPDLKKRNSPEKLQLIHEKNEVFVEKIRCGCEHSIFLTKNNILMAFGSNKFGQCGFENSKKFISKPTEIPFFKGKEILDFKVGGFHNFVILKDLTVFAFGNNSENQCGIQAKKNSKKKDSEIKNRENSDEKFSISDLLLKQTEKPDDEAIANSIFAPRKIIFPTFLKVSKKSQKDSKFPWKRLELGGFFTILMTKENKIFGCGKNEYLELGNLPEKNTKNTEIWKEIPNLEKFVEIEEKFENGIEKVQRIERDLTKDGFVPNYIKLGSNNGFLILERKNPPEQKLICWGSNCRKQVGLEDDESEVFLPFVFSEITKKR